MAQRRSEWKGVEWRGHALRSRQADILVVLVLYSIEASILTVCKFGAADGEANRPSSLHLAAFARIEWQFSLLHLEYNK